MSAAVHPGRSSCRVASRRSASGTFEIARALACSCVILVIPSSPAPSVRQTGCLRHHARVVLKRRCAKGCDPSITVLGECVADPFHRVDDRLHHGVQKASGASRAYRSVAWISSARLRARRVATLVMVPRRRIVDVPVVTARARGKAGEDLISVAHDQGGASVAVSSTAVIGKCAFTHAMQVGDPADRRGGGTNERVNQSTVTPARLIPLERLPRSGGVRLLVQRRMPTERRTVARASGLASSRVDR